MIPHDELNRWRPRGCWFHNDRQKDSTSCDPDYQSPARLVVEEDTERLALEYERDQIQEETPQKVIGEMGQVVQAEAVVVEDNDSQETRRWALLCCDAVMLVLYYAYPLGN